MKFRTNVLMAGLVWAAALSGWPSLATQGDFECLVAGQSMDYKDGSVWVDKVVFVYAQEDVTKSRVEIAISTLDALWAPLIFDQNVSVEHRTDGELILAGGGSDNTDLRIEIDFIYAHSATGLATIRIWDDLKEILSLDKINCSR